MITPLRTLPMSEKKKKLIEEIVGKRDLKLTRLSGGDTNEVYKIDLGTKAFVLKLNNATNYPGMFDAEHKGLDLLGSTCSIKIPEVFKTGTSGDISFILMEYIETGENTKGSWRLFGRQLAQLHSNTHAQFGLDHTNYLGSIPQHNNYRDNTIEFFVDMRLKPQLKLARDNNYTLPNTSTLFKNIKSIIPMESASLIHGDLWKGNYLVNELGKPVLLDPAVAYAPREMDLAMMKLFGGFSENLMETYQEILPLLPNWKERVELWQLYYLLMHLNAFGRSYLYRVVSIIQKYS